MATNVINTASQLQTDKPGHNTSPSKPPELELNLRPGVHMSPPRTSMRGPPGMAGSPPVVGSPPGGIDELSDSFSASFNVTNTPNDVNRPHPRFAQYKQKSTGLTQASRRRDMLDRQKKNREDLVNHARALAMGDIEEGDIDEDEDEVEEMDTTGEIRERRLRRTYSKQLMLSEWLVEVPEDLEDNWLLLLCPEGRRNLVVASNGQTKVYSKSGKQVKSFPSHLPGGNRSQGRARQKYTLLDCIFSDTNGIFYILDMMCWDGYQYYDCDTEFRLTWVQQKFVENKDLITRSRINPYSFLPLPVYQCNKEGIAEALNSPMPFQERLDGLLFYHRNVHYMPGKTPLVAWLKGYMVPELLNIQVSDELIEQTPTDYPGMKTYLKKTYDRVERMKKEDEERYSNAQVMESQS